jgi:hypothetical protein
MNPLMQHSLKSKAARRKHLMMLSYPEKVRIVEQLREAARTIRSTNDKRLALHEEMPAYGKKKH